MTTDSFCAQYERYRQAETAANAHNKTVVFDALAAAGIALVCVAFDGYGDSGQIANMEWQPSQPAPGINVTLRGPAWDGSVRDGTEPLTLAEAVEELCYGYLGEDSAGWQDNDGSFGDFVFDVAARTVTLTINWRFTDFETNQQTY